MKTLDAEPPKAKHSKEELEPTRAAALVRRPLELKVLEFEVDDSPHVIPNEKAYRHTVETVEGMKRALAGHRAQPREGLDPVMQELVEDSLQALIEEWGAQVREYEEIKSGAATLSLRSLRELPAVLVKARLAAGLTQKQLAQKLGIKPQQIQRYESTRYRTITLERMLQIAEVLGLRVEAQIAIGR